MSATAVGAGLVSAQPTSLRSAARVFVLWSFLERSARQNATLDVR